MLAFKRLQVNKSSIAALIASRPAQLGCLRLKSNTSDSGIKPDPKVEPEVDPKSYFYPNTSVGIKERSVSPKDKKPVEPLQTPYPPFPGGKNPKTGEEGGPVGPEPTRYGDWERKGRVTDF